MLPVVSLVLTGLVVSVRSDLTATACRTGATTAWTWKDTNQKDNNKESMNTSLIPSSSDLIATSDKPGQWKCSVVNNAVLFTVIIMHRPPLLSEITFCSELPLSMIKARRPRDNRGACSIRIAGPLRSTKTHYQAMTAWRRKGTRKQSNLRFPTLERKSHTCVIKCIWVI